MTKKPGLWKVNSLVELEHLFGEFGITLLKVQIDEEPTHFRKRIDIVVAEADFYQAGSIAELIETPVNCIITVFTPGR